MSSSPHDTRQTKHNQETGIKPVLVIIGLLQVSSHGRHQNGWNQNQQGIIEQDLQVTHLESKKKKNVFSRIIMYIWYMM